MKRAAHPLALAVIGALALGACANPGDPNRYTKRGTTIGAGAGALAGMMATDGGESDARDALIGAAIGASIGASVGAGLDRQAAELRRDLGDGRITVANTGSELVVTLPQDIVFATDSAAIRPDLQRDLQVLARSLNAYPDTAVGVIGHTDNTGDAAYNQALSARRAAAVAAVLTGAGVAPARIDARGRGEDQPVASNLTAEGRAKNRRVEIVIRPVA